MNITQPETRAANRWAIATFVGVTLLSAFLLFQVQPLVSKAILPWFGGCPAVWTTCLLFFQAVLFGGYLYAHLLDRCLTPRRQAIVHGALVAAALIVLPVGPGAEWKPADDSYPTARILRLLTATVGLPYFLLSATSPLVQAWFRGRYPGRSPYRLYAVSNFGSLAALLTYPLVFEPAMAVRAQSLLWSSAFLVYAMLCAALAACVWTVSSPLPAERSASASGGGQGVRAADRLRWLALPALASLMLVAGTNHLCQDVAVVPFLWVLPLTLYLISFIVCFDRPQWYIRWLWAGAAAVELIGAAACDHLKLTSSPLSLPQELTLSASALFFVCMVCHGELYRLKPSPRHLTEYYLWIAAGGAAGGLFVGLVAPKLFTTYLEWPIGVAASALLCVGLLLTAGPGGRSRAIRYALILPPAALGLFFLAKWEFTLDSALDRSRNFFGAISVTEIHRDDPAKHLRLLKHGSITHGCQFLDPRKRRWTTTYYGENSGLGRVIEFLRRKGKMRLGAVGLGVGTLAAYAEPGDFLRFYEINPEVLRMARRHFFYLADCRTQWDVVLGDARLSLEAQPPQRFDILVVDAFSGDAVPTHLLTQEAFEVYRKHLAPGGVIAVHVSNTYLRLGPVVRRVAESRGLKTTTIRGQKDDDRQLAPNEWVLATLNEDFLREYPPEPIDPSIPAPLWTDQYSNLFQILISRSERK